MALARNYDDECSILFVVVDVALWTTFALSNKRKFIETSYVYYIQQSKQRPIRCAKFTVGDNATLRLSTS